MPDSSDDDVDEIEDNQNNSEIDDELSDSEMKKGNFLIS